MAHEAWIQAELGIGKFHVWDKGGDSRDSGILLPDKHISGGKILSSKDSQLAMQASGR
jgi:hypothetical protein